MSYYGKGDFYGTGSGYYHGGDPFWGALLAGAASLVGKVFSRAKTVIAPAAAGVAHAVIQSKVGQGTAWALRQGGQVVSRHPVLSGAGAAGLLGAGGFAVGRSRGHPILSGAGGSASRFRGGMPGQFGRRRRRMHVTNVKALRRAIRRAHGFEKLARKVMGFSSPHKPKGRAYFKRPRKR